MGIKRLHKWRERCVVWIRIRQVIIEWAELSKDPTWFGEWNYGSSVNPQVTECWHSMKWQKKYMCSWEWLRFSLSNRQEKKTE